MIEYVNHLFEVREARLRKVYAMVDGASIPEMTWAALAASVAAGETLAPVAAIVAAHDYDPADIAIARSAPVITVVVDDSVAGEQRRLADLAVSEDQLGRVVSAIVANPQAAATLALLLRATADLPLAEAIQAESLAYATLQGGREFADWLATRPAPVPPPPSHQPLLVRSASDGTTLVLHRPNSANALDRSLRHALTLAMNALAFSDEPIALEGAGAHFCSGGDLREFGLADSPTSAHLDRMRANLPLAVARVAARTTARVHGACVGGGMELSSFAARVVASPDTRWRLPEVQMGLIAGCGGTVSVTRRIGRQRMLGLALTGETIEVGQALQWGLVDEVV